MQTCGCAGALEPEHALAEPVHHVVPTRNEVDDDSCLSARRVRRILLGAVKRRSDKEVKLQHIGQRAEVVGEPSRHRRAGRIAVAIGGREHNRLVRVAERHDIQRSVVLVLELRMREARDQRAAPTGSPSTVWSGTNGGSMPSVGTASGIPIVPANHRAAHSCYKRFCAIKVSFLARFDEIKDRRGG